MFTPDDPLSPPQGHFDEPWQASVLAMAVAMIREGHMTQSAWAQALGAELQKAEAEGAPDTNTTYFTAALAALETLSEQAGISSNDRDRQKDRWRDAYANTPHGQPVTLLP